MFIHSFDKQDFVMHPACDGILLGPGNTDVNKTEKNF